ncbi:MAG: T9SS type A sorting domain-containing protein, partial [Saprospiraceae bacterium]
DDIKVMSLPVGVEEIKSGMDWKVFPNPAFDQLTIELANNTKKINVIITDITGKIMYSTTVSGNQIIEVNVKDFLEGVYVVQIQSSEFIQSQKLIVTK